MDTPEQWARNVINHLTDYNDNTKIPTVNLVFDTDKLPITSTTATHNNNFLYIDNNYYVKSPDEIFVNQTTNTCHSFGSIMTDNLRKQHTQHDKFDQHLTTYTLSNPNTKSTQQVNLLDYISTTIDRTPHNGLYEFQINTQIQNDSGANRSVTNLISLLHNFKEIDPYPIGGVNSETPAIYCTGLGYLKWYSEDKQLIQVPCYYCAEASGTIISPTDIVYTHLDNFTGWQMTTNIDTKTGTFILIARDGINHIKYPTFMRNNLWYHYLFQPTTSPTSIPEQPQSIIRSMNYSAIFELWHLRLGHPGRKITQKFFEHTIGVPLLKPNKFYNCAACMSCKFRNRHIPRLNKSADQPSNDKIYQLTETSPKLPNFPTNVGQHLHMDYGFVRGSDWSSTTNDGKLVTSIDKYRAYLLVIDKTSRYIWIYLTKDKSPPIKQVEGLLTHFQRYQFATIMTDQGGELAKSNAFKLLCQQQQYILQPTGAYASKQNGLAEKPNQDLAQIMRCLLYSAGLDSRFWSYALRHAVYLKNRWPHASLNWMTPYESIHQQKPDLSHLRVFGSLVNVKSSAKRYMKLDTMSSQGIFMTYSGTDKNVYVVNQDGTNERLTTHVSYDEAHMSSTKSTLPHMAISLQQKGYFHPTDKTITDPSTQVKIKISSPEATLPTKATPHSAGFDMYSAEQTTIPPSTQKLIDTKVSMEIPTKYFGMLKSRSGLALKHNIHVQAGIIDSDYRGHIKILLTNESDTPFEITQGMRIAQLIIFHIPNIELLTSDNLTETNRNTKGFGSSGTHKLLHNNIPTQSNPNINPTHAAAAKMDDNSILDDDTIPYNVICSNDPFTDSEVIKIPVRGKHVTQGLILEHCPIFQDRIVIKSIQPGTSPRNIKRWIHRIKNCHLLQINDTLVHSVAQANKILNNITKNDRYFKITVSQDQRTNIHPDNGLPMLYFDQLSTISRHLHHIKALNDNDTISTTATSHKINQSSSHQQQYISKIINAVKQHGTINAAKAILPKNKRSSNKLTRRKLKNMETWPEWQQSEYKQLDQYYDQQMFGEPCRLPAGANVLDLLWTYLVKTDGTKKARCVCNGQPKFKGTVVFGYTFAKMLDHVGSRIFWGTVAAKNLIVRGADASNAFAEANAPDIPLYVRIDNQYREWYLKRFNKTIPPNYVLPVQKALQGHPESSRLWALHMDKILKTKFNLKPTTHEGCLYQGKYKNEDILFLRQVDDFAVAAEQESTAISLIKDIDSHMTIDIKDLGLLNRYNGVDIMQTKYFVKISNETYINKLLKEHDWLLTENKPSNIPIPIKNETTFHQRVEKAIPPNNEKDTRLLQLEMGFNYRQAIGELIFLMITCRPDISYPLIKLSQYSNSPAKEHYECVKQLFQYIKATKTDGIYFWRKHPRNDLPEAPFPSTIPQTHQVDPSSRCDDPEIVHGAVDSDWAGDSNHRNSVTGIIIKYAGGTIYFKTKFQDTIAMSSTEAEFTAACDAAKAILYIRSILAEINIPQEEATTLFIDNNGALLMANAQQPTRRTRHMDIKHFALTDWVERDLVIMKRINTTDNYADSMTKSLGRQLHYRHTDYILGKIIPSYAAAYHIQQPHTTV